MPASYRLVDYSVRPAKHVERKMLCELFRRLIKFGAIEHYQYVGFGAIWFSDFSLFHRTLGINRMYSIEREIQHRERFEFNRPFGGVELLFGNSAQELPKINWQDRTIAWLDYDDQLNLSILADVRGIVSSACSGTMLLVTMQSHNRPSLPDHDRTDTVEAIETVEQFRSTFGVSRTPSDMTDQDLYGWKLGRLYRNVLLNEIADALAAVNAVRNVGNQMRFKQVLALEYADGAKMTTLGGVFVDEGQEPIYNACDFERLPFYRNGLDALRLEVPRLTPKEMRELERFLPCEDLPSRSISPVPPREVQAFGNLYRYLPNFASFEP